LYNFNDSILEIGAFSCLRDYDRRVDHHE
jgi:hypothetical protein